MCDCLGKRQFEEWFANECNQTATNQTQTSSTTDNNDMFKNVDGPTILIAVVTGVAMTTLIWLSVMFARFRKPVGF